MNLPTTDDDGVLAYVAGLDPAPSDDADAAAALLVTEMARAASGPRVTPLPAPTTAALAPTARRARRRRRLVTAMVLTGALAAPATAVAAVQAGALTGIFGTGKGEEADRSEWVDLGAPDAAAVIARQAPTDLPLPAGRSWATARQELTSSLTAVPPEGARMQLTGIRLEYEGWGQCAWQVDWIKAEDAGDPARRAAALEHLRAYVDTPVYRKTDGGNMREFDLAMYDKAARGDGSTLRRSTSINCPARMAAEVGPVIVQENK